MPEKIKTLLVDDEPMALKGLVNYVKKLEALELVAACENAMDAMDTLKSTKVDLMFLDIQMPKFSGLQLLKSLTAKPITVICSAYPQYAFEGFELDVIDYLLKPVAFDRFSKAVNKAKEFLNNKGTEGLSTETENFLFVKSNKIIEKIFFDEILYVEALHNYIAVQTSQRKIISYLSLKNIEDRLPDELFMKIQKSFIVALNKITRVDTNAVYINEIRIPISRSNREEVMQLILGTRYLKR